jgi:peptide methionine sulfoxide reductase msrA/msrB
MRNIVPLLAVLAALVLVACTKTPRLESGLAPRTEQAPSQEPVQAERPAAAVHGDLRSRLSPLAYAVTQEAATEPAFQNAYWDEHRPGLYVDVIDGTPLFSSRDKFDSGTGWPSFTRPIEASRVTTGVDRSLFMERVEVRSASSGAHLGHVFDDGPPPLRTRYCMNSAALRFVPAADLAREGYEAFAREVGGTGVADAPAEACAPKAERAGASGCRATTEVAILAGGCFWGMEEILRQVAGVLETTAGYTGGSTAHPTYDDVHTGTTGHAEAVRVVFDPSRVTFRALLDDWFFRMHDPTTPNRQGNDRGTQYRSAIFATSDAQFAEAQEAKARAALSGRWSAPIVTEIVRAGAFTPAEDVHQRYLQKHPGGYTCHYLRN